MKKLLQKNYVLLLVVAVLSFGLVACSEGNNELSTAEVLENYSEASKVITSGKMNTEIFVATNVAGQGSEITMTSNIEFTTEPIAMKIDSTVGGNGSEIKTTSYMDDKIMYTQVPGSETWQKVELSSLGLDLETLTNSFSSEETLNLLKENEKDIKVTKEGEDYILTYSGNGDSIKAVIKQMSSAMAPEMSQLFDNMTINSFDYKVVIDSKTFLQKNVDTNVEMVMNIEGQEMTMNQEQKVTFENLNNVKEVIIPEEVKK
ncbi:DUF6612 family protein [Anaerosphaera multitolerans]|uniref:LppX_LprAFG lipoprotein n=1 Tax=Anaerosphaera multitolerans TaxID=2487351 RepID=A0A437S5S5_9FIRM|nr:DUF6612 family protein [Anaerosphaera multitolerans]RVU54402.1 hypothetical protein EF514_07345 [Anaerosphaera multitolerans]